MASNDKIELRHDGIQVRTVRCRYPPHLDVECKRSALARLGRNTDLAALQTAEQACDEETEA